MLRDLREQHKLQRTDAKNLFEIHYPDKFTKAHPWGPIPDDEWDEAKEVNPFLYSFQSANLGKLKGLKFSTNVLCHVTHNEHAEEIRPNRLDRYHYTFKPKQELGKEYIYDGRPLGETYLNTVSFWNLTEFPEFIGIPITPDQMKYQKIPGTVPVLPGYYSWWGISLEDQLPQQAIDAVRALEQHGTYVAGYVKCPPESTYGNNVFCVSFYNLLKSYANSRQCSMSKIHLKVGGTLRYRYEVCYVTIICTEDDLETFSKFNDFKHKDILVNRVLEPNGLVGQDGRVVDPRAVPTFSPNYVINYYSGTRKSISWEGIAFALYFPDGDLTLRCPTAVIEERSIRHELCISKQPPTNPQGMEWVCPNDN